ncbi:hypothetical protein CLD20_14650 [Afifella sp. IM 167]|nr:hypothetical protein [Afifella sp. IM 167]
MVSAVAAAAFVLPAAAAQPRADAPSVASAVAALRTPAQAGKLAWLTAQYASDDDPGPRLRPGVAPDEDAAWDGMDMAETQGPDPSMEPGPGFAPPFGPPPDPRMMIAERLATAETYVGIRADQLDVWRGYTDALLDLLAASPRQLDAKLHPRPGKHPQDGSPSVFGEGIADAAIERSVSARSLKEASRKLRQELSDEQLERLAAFAPPFPPSGGFPAERFDHPAPPDLEGERVERGDIRPPHDGD